MSDLLDCPELRWTDLSLFYATAQREESDPDAVKDRAVVLFGEGTWVAPQDRPMRRVQKLSAGVKVLRIVDENSKIQCLLTSSHFDHQKERFITGLTERPPVVGLPDDKGTIREPFRGSYKLHQFIRLNKSSLVRALADSIEEPEGMRAAIAARLEEVRRVSNRSFSGDELRWLGDVLIAERYRGYAYWNPVHSSDGKSCRELEVVVTNPASRLSMQVRAMGTDDMCLADDLLDWSDYDKTPKRIQFQEELGTVQLRVWVNGKLVQEETSSVFRGIEGKILTGAGSSIALQDRLTEKLEKAIKGGAASQETLERATRAGGRQLGIAFGNSMTDEKWSSMNCVPRQLFDVVRPEAEKFSYFPAQAEGRGNAVLHFAQLISTADQAYLVDPWFDALGAGDLLPRLSGDGQLTILTNLPLDQVAQKGKLREYLVSLARVGLAYQLEVICLSSSGSSPRQVFHDRYLLTRSGANWRGFVLTNSFSGLAARYPLFVVEAPLATTARLLDEFENLASRTEGADKLWPPAHPETKPKQSESYRSFPYSHALLTKVASRCANDTQKLVRLGAARGFINLREDDWTWYSDQDCTSELLNWLIPVQSSTRSRLRLRHNPRPRMFDIGTAVHVLGDLCARGLRITALEVALRTSSKAVDIERSLRKTFPDPKDPTRDGPNISAQRLGLRQTLRRDVDKIEAFRAGAAAWLHLDVRPERTTHWNRTFAYAVLLQIDPTRAVRLSLELLDADFLLSLAGPRQSFRIPWDMNLARALASSEAPFLRAYGIQSFAFEALRAETPRDDLVPPDVECAVRRLAEEGIPQDEIALILLIWAQQRRSSSAGPGKALGRILLDLGSGPQTRIFRALCESNQRNAELVAEVVNGMSDNGATSVQLEMLLKIFGEKFSQRPKDYSVTVPRDSAFAFVIGRTVKMLIAAGKESSWDMLRRLMHANDVEKDTVPLSPFRWRPQIVDFRDLWTPKGGIFQKDSPLCS